MLCPLAKSNPLPGLIVYGGELDVDADIARKQGQCSGADCGWWHHKYEQCALVTIAQCIDHIDDRQEDRR